MKRVVHTNVISTCFIFFIKSGLH